MKSRIPKIFLSLALAVPAGYGTAAAVQRGWLEKALGAVLFYGNLPARIGDAVTNFKALPERLHFNCSDCN